MAVTIFNLHDIVLIMIIVFSLLFSAMLAFGESMNKRSSYLLTAFMLAHALIAIHELTYFGEQFRYAVLEFSPNVFFLGNIAYCLDAVLLFFYVKSIVFKGFAFKKQDLVHLLPAFGFTLFLFFGYYNMTTEAKNAAILNWSFSESAGYVAIDLTIKLIRFAYLFACINLVARYYIEHKSQLSDLRHVEIRWLNLLVKGFLGIMLVEVILCLFKVKNYYQPIDKDWLIITGISVYYLTFALIVALLIYSVNKTATVVPVSDSRTLNDTLNAQSSFKVDFIEKLENMMVKTKPYLVSDLNIDNLSAQLGVSAKDLSVTLNRHYQMNFYEFINRYRIEEAKKLLINKPELSITELLYEVGFNTKSVFYTFFKKIEGMTPSEYKKRKMEEANKKQ